MYDYTSPADLCRWAEQQLSRKTIYQLGGIGRCDSSGRRVFDCVGLIKCFLWHDYGPGNTGYYGKTAPDINADQMYSRATVKGPISTIPEIPGLLVWQRGHIGIYIGGGQVIEATAKRWGSVGGCVVKSQFRDKTAAMYRGTWTHWLRCPFLMYPKEAEDMGIKDSYTTEVYNGLTIQIARMGLDPDYEYKGTVVGKPFGPNAVQRSQSIDDPELEAASWQSCGHTNGGIFYKEPSDGNWMASGIEVLMGNATQLWDTRFDSCAALGFYHSGEMIIATQAEIKTLAAAGQLRGAVTAAFGVKLNGQRWTAGSEFNSQRDYIYSNKSGRTIVGQAVNGQYVMVSVPGVSGKSGLTGSQLPALADHLGLTAAVCLDGGGSRYLSYCGSIKTNTTRAVKNDIIIYRRKKATPAPDPDPDTQPDHQPDVSGDGMVLITDKGPLRIRNAVMGDKILYTVPQGEQIDILDMLAGRQRDGYQWAFVSYTPPGKSDKIIGYSQVDGNYSVLDEKED